MFAQVGLVLWKQFRFCGLEPECSDRKSDYNLFNLWFDDDIFFLGLYDALLAWQISTWQYFLDFDDNHLRPFVQ
jgi:hypothetical protein